MSKVYMREGESVHYRWLLFDRNMCEAFFSPNYDIDDSPTLSNWGLYCFPPFTIFPRYNFNSSDPFMAVNALRTWAEGVCIPMRVAMPQKQWEEYVRVDAYFRWEAEGRPEGRALEHWCAAAEQLADLLKTEYAFVRFEQPEVACGSYEAYSHGDIIEPGPDGDVSGGQGGGEGTSETARKSGGLGGFLKSLTSGGLAPGRLVQPAGQGTGRLVIAKKATGKEKE